jgi:hypothetical protein
MEKTWKKLGVFQAFSKGIKKTKMRLNPLPRL